MKTTITGIVFSAASRTLDFSAISNFDISRLFAVINASADTVIYAAGKPGFGFSNIAAGVVTLKMNTTGMQDADKIVVVYDQPEAMVSAASPILVPGQQAVSLSLNARGALRTIAQAPDGTDLDPAAPTRTAPYATGTMTVAAAAVGTATPTAPVAAAVVGGPKRRKIYNTGTTTIWYGPLATLTADVAAATSGIPLLAGASDDLEGYTGEIYVRGAAAGSVGIRTIG